MDLINEVKGFLTPVKRKRKNIYIVDADNYQANLDKLLSSKKTAMIICLSSSPAITTGIYHQIDGKTKSVNRLHIYNVNPGKDSTDIFMASLLGWMIGKYGTFYDYYLISGDRIFDSLKTEYGKLGYNIETMREF